MANQVNQPPKSQKNSEKLTAPNNQQAILPMAKVYLLTYCKCLEIFHQKANTPPDIKISKNR